MGQAPLEDVLVHRVARENSVDAYRPGEAGLDLTHRADAFVQLLVVVERPRVPEVRDRVRDALKIIDTVPKRGRMAEAMVDAALI